MALADYKPETATIKLKNTSFTVRGFSTEDVANALRENFYDIEAILDEIFRNKAQANTFTNKGIEDVVLLIAQRAPVFAARLIAIAADEEDQIDTIRRLPFPIQVQALLEAFRLSFEEVGGVKKWFESLAPTLTRLLPSDAIESLNQVAQKRRKQKGLEAAQ